MYRQHKKWCIKLTDTVTTMLMYCVFFGWIPLVLVLFLYVVPFVLVPYMN